MKIWPIILDSRPPYLKAEARLRSALLLPMGTHTLLEHLCAWLAPVTNRPPSIVPEGVVHPEYGTAIQSVSDSVTILASPRAIADRIATYELSDALLVLDPVHSLPLQPEEIVRLIHQYRSEPRVAHHLVAFEGAVAGTKERVSVDATGRVRKILRHYERATWPFISGVPATVLPVASGLLADGTAPRSLAELRQILAIRGVPSRDVPMDGIAIALTEEGGVLAATTHFVRKSVQAGRGDNGYGRAILVGSSHRVHENARMTGPVVIHDRAEVGEGAVICGPSVIGAGARVLPGAVVAHATIGPGCTIPPGAIVRNQVCFDPEFATADDDQTVPYGQRLARVVAEARTLDAATPEAANSPGIRTRRVRFKRALDACAAALALVLLSPILVLAAIAVWLESRGSIFYGDEREGLGGRVFRCWKFRTMYVGAHAIQTELKAQDKMDGPHFKLDRDPRVTRVGRILRALNVDELPQLFNVLVGEMSLVGPRPSPFRENQICVPWREARLSVRPGITGFWQVCRHDRSAGDFHQWIEYDLLYVQNMSLWLDIKILLATIATLGGKATHLPASWLVSDLPAEPQPAAAATATTVPAGASVERAVST